MITGVLQFCVHYIHTCEPVGLHEMLMHRTERPELLTNSVDNIVWLNAPVPWKCQQSVSFRLSAG